MSVQKYLCFLLGHKWIYHPSATVRTCKECKEKQYKPLGTYISPRMLNNKWKTVKTIKP